MVSIDQGQEGDNFHRFRPALDRLGTEGLEVKFGLIRQGLGRCAVHQNGVIGETFRQFFQTGRHINGITDHGVDQPIDRANLARHGPAGTNSDATACLLYTSDAADE